MNEKVYSGDSLQNNMGKGKWVGVTKQSYPWIDNCWNSWGYIIPFFLLFYLFEIICNLKKKKTKLKEYKQNNRRKVAGEIWSVFVFGLLANIYWAFGLCQELS